MSVLSPDPPDVAMAWQTLREAQERFMETHRAYANLRKARKDPKSVRERIQEQEKETQQLADRVQQIKNKVTSKMSQGELAPLRMDAEKITRAQVESEGIKASMEKQRALIDEHKQRYGSTAARLRELKGIAASGSAEALIRQLKEEVAQLRRAGDAAAQGSSNVPPPGRLSSLLLQWRPARVSVAGVSRPGWRCSGGRCVGAQGEGAHAPRGDLEEGRRRRRLPGATCAFASAPSPPRMLPPPP